MLIKTGKTHYHMLLKERMQILSECQPHKVFLVVVTFTYMYSERLKTEEPVLADMSTGEKLKKNRKLLHLVVIM